MENLVNLRLLVVSGVSMETIWKLLFIKLATRERWEKRFSEMGQK